MKLSETARDHRLQENFSCRLLINLLIKATTNVLASGKARNNHLPRKLVTQLSKGLIRSTSKALTERKKVNCAEPTSLDPESSLLTPPPL